MREDRCRQPGHPIPVPACMHACMQARASLVALKEEAGMPGVLPAIDAERVERRIGMR
jgi:hypothetical protein